jgi:hypothetical protein
MGSQEGEEADIDEICMRTRLQLIKDVKMAITTAKTRATNRNFLMMIRRREGFLTSLFDKGVLSSGSSAGRPILSGTVFEGKPCSS